MVDVLPRNVNIYTRQPIVLKLRFDAQYKRNRPSLMLTIPSLNREDPATHIESLRCQEVRYAIQKRMNDIARQENDGFVIAEEIFVEV
eukprot:1454634-Ditylum_brightwellii.AAC.1